MNLKPSNSSVRRTVRTFVVSTLALFVPGLLGWLNELTQWAANQGATPFPDAHGLAYLGVSALTGGVIAAVQFLWNYVEDLTGKGFLRDVGPATLSEEDFVALSADQKAHLDENDHA